MADGLLPVSLSIGLAYLAFVAADASIRAAFGWFGLPDVLTLIASALFSPFFARVASVMMIRIRRSLARDGVLELMLRTNAGLPAVGAGGGILCADQEMNGVPDATRRRSRVRRHGCS